MLSYYIVLTDSCNLLCPSCIRKNISTSRGTLSIEAFDKIISIIKSQTEKDSSVTITGGEPLLNPHWERMARECLKEFNRVCICSNGKISNDNLRLIKSCMKDGMFLQLSLDGDRDADNSIRGANHYESAIKTLTELEEFSNNLVVSTTVSRANISSMDNLVHSLNSMRFLFWKVSWEQSLFPQQDVNMLTCNEWNNFVDRILELCYFPVKIAKLFDFELWSNHIEEFSTGGERITNCGFGQQKIYIFPNGDVYPCTCFSSWRIGNILYESFDEIKRRIDSLTNFQIPKDSVCFSCKFNQICNTGCPGYSMKVFGKLGYGDIRCPLVTNYHD